MEYWVISDITLLRHYQKLTIQQILCLDPPLSVVEYIILLTNNNFRLFTLFEMLLLVILFLIMFYFFDFDVNYLSVLQNND